ncbi:hypothetical protein A5692_05650 [Mycobacterium sp. E342]|uniref:hypothetical protein n=1 Tax=Mycobacterium sp. E342 TaxID=1834147 RepID=UPI0007FCC30F|nr:hypothetical protein [Mycobacterium sp. E342]OBH23846.1 hypothetical protein A5692_05650 [Mycobacterium sp. E342]
MQAVRVSTAALQVMATGWAASADELEALAAPTASGFSCQASASAVNVAHADVTAFTAALASRVRAQATRVTEADGRYDVNETDSADEMAAVVHSTIAL